MIRIFEVGGHVRDGLLGLESKDIDMAVEADSWKAMLAHVKKNTKKVFLEKPEFLTIRAMGFDGLVKDFVLCRKDGAYSDGRRPDTVEMGTIYDDLNRRDFTVNAIARDPDSGELLDPHGGQVDLKTMTLKCVGSANDRFNEDALRILRAIRFCITKGFSPDRDIEDVLFGSGAWGGKMIAVSRNRTRDEVEKCFKHNTIASIQFFAKIDPGLRQAIFGDDLWLKATVEKRKGHGAK